jgi:hypothetical protein
MSLGTVKETGVSFPWIVRLPVREWSYRKVMKSKRLKRVAGLRSSEAASWSLLAIFLRAFPSQIGIDVLLKLFLSSKPSHLKRPTSGRVMKGASKG